MTNKRMDMGMIAVIYWFVIVTFCLFVSEAQSADNLPWQDSFPLHKISEKKNKFHLPARLDFEIHPETYQAILDIHVGGAGLKVALDSKYDGFRIFLKNTNACKDRFSEKLQEECLDVDDAQFISWCNNTSACNVPKGPPSFNCSSVLNHPLSEDGFHDVSDFRFDNLTVSETKHEGKALIAFDDLKTDNNQTAAFVGSPVKFLRAWNYTFEEWPLFRDVGGILGIAGDKCRPEPSLFEAIRFVTNSTFVLFNFDLFNNSTLSVNGNCMMLANDSSLEEALQQSYDRIRDHPKNDNLKENENLEINNLENDNLEKEQKDESDLLRSEMYSTSLLPNVQWSQSRQSEMISVSNYMEFEIYNPRVCQYEHILMPSSSHWTAKVDLGSKCLGLPVFMWHRLMQWLPVKCETLPKTLYRGSTDNSSDSDIQQDEDIPSKRPYLCYLKSETDTPPSLPTLTFQLTYTGERLTIFLDALVLPTTKEGDSSKKNFLCIVPLSSPLSSGMTDNPFISFGTMAMQFFHVISDYPRKRLGFLQKSGFTYSDAHCSPRSVCGPEQFYDVRTNKCLDPDCSYYWFKSLDPETNRCTFRGRQYIIAICLVVVATMLEMFGIICNRYTVQVSQDARF